MPKTLLIVEEALRDLKAHWFEYIKTITQAAEAQGYVVEVACHRNAEPKIRQTFESYPVFRHARYLDNHTRKLPGERYYGFILHSLRSLQVLWPLLGQRDRYTHIFVPTVLIHHLLAWWMIMRFHPNRPDHLTLFFVANPGVWDAEQQRSQLPKSPMLTIQRSLLRWFQPMLNKGNVTLAVETKGAKDEFEELTDLPFRLFPHPVPSITQQSSPLLSDISSLRFACYGFARYEKGSDLFRTAIERIIGPEGKHPQFCVQWVDAFQLPDGHVCSPDDLVKHPAVEVIDRPLDSQDYQIALQKTQCMILPYRNSSYHARVSRVAIEAACLGIPMIYTKGGWLEDIVSEFGAGIGIQDEDVEDLIWAISQIASEYNIWHQRAIDQQKTAQRYFSSNMFCHLLFSTVQQQPVQLTRTALDELQRINISK